VRLSLDVSPELNDVLEQLAEATHSSKSDVLRRAIALMRVAVEAQVNGDRLVVRGCRDSVEIEIVGLAGPTGIAPRDGRP
jgi:predicted transcriptional regulator